MQSSPTSPETSSDVAEHIHNLSLKAARALSTDFGVQVGLKQLCDAYLKDLSTQGYFCKGLYSRVGEQTLHTYEYGLAGDFIKKGVLENKSFSLQFMLQYVIDDKGIKDVVLKVKALPFSSIDTPGPAEQNAVLVLSFGRVFENNPERKLGFIHAVLQHELQTKLRNHEEGLLAEWLNTVVHEWETVQNDSQKNHTEVAV